MQGRNIQGQSYKTFMHNSKWLWKPGISSHSQSFLYVTYLNRSGINCAGVNIWLGLFIDANTQKKVPHGDEVNPIAIIGRTSKRSLRLQY